MADELFINPAAREISGSTGVSAQQKTGRKQQTGEEEFLTMLVAQLKSQAAAEPKSTDGFAVNLAQFNEFGRMMEDAKCRPAGDVASMASYLGQEVLVASRTVSLRNGGAGEINFDLEQPAESVTVELLDEAGNGRSLELGAAAAGSRSATLAGLDAADGEYQVRVTATGADGQTSRPQVYTAGVVSGFVPGADPVLLVGGKEVSPGDIKEVRNGPERA